MNDESPAMRGSRRRPGGMHCEINTAIGLRLAERAQLLDVRKQLAHAIDELESRDAGIDAARAILERLLEDFDHEVDPA